MAVTEAQTVDVSQVVASMLAGVDGLRTDWYVSDASRPPVAVIGLPYINWADPSSTFCWAVWEYPVTVATARNNDRDAQLELSRLVRDVAVALDGPTPPGVFDVTLLDARYDPNFSISGQALPAYLVRVQVRA
jgi:hypothetical protein